MKVKLKIITVAGVLLLFVGMFASIHIGAKNISAEEIYHAFFQYEDTLNDQLVRNIRLPRMLCGVLTGGMLALTGTMMQGVLRNPIAEPSIMGVTQGATLAVAISSVTFIVGGTYGNFLMSLLGAFISGGLILAFTMCRASNQSVSRILLAGTAMSTFFLSLASVVALLGNRSQELAFWVAGGLRQAGWIQVGILSGVGGIFSIAAIFLSKKINLISLGDEVAIGLGVSPKKVKIHTILYLIPICAVCVATAGNIGFIGLFVPHIIRKWIGNDYRNLMPLSFLYGSVILVFADIAARTISAPYELPVGLFTACIGVPVFLLLVRKEKS
ncbi:FecCD family ABC transporter permease [Velocimicrobium porci]|mgnify:CR=1 FL=1|uniref:Iron ABC transporter permease n=1 Tax=Velocimicrobium porci TaxID=2606634 RepID=A0A6L5Y0R9_9FIRM|nr:iron ABC transporter permease [Velocimicrobium porci]MSS64726.1 iron ABC transporter permease [Velocimicrobium porci]